MTLGSQNPDKISSSFRDPSGFVFRSGSYVYRQINSSYSKEYDKLMSSGLYDELAEKGLMLRHKETSEKGTPGSYKVILPEQVPFLSYAYEWSFSQLKDAALLTLEIEKTALSYDMTLKDASAYNIQFLRGKPVLIDTLSFDFYKEGEPWVAYKQFCQHFLAPLALMSKTDLRLNKLLEIYLDGIPLDLASRLLPSKTRWTLGLGIHLHYHAKGQQKYTDPNVLKKQKGHLGKNQLLGIISSLNSTVASLHLPKQKTVWGEYYDDTNYSKKAFEQKKQIISRWIMNLKPKTVWDAGGNDGTFSRLTSDKKIPTISSDIDELAIESSYLKTKENGEEKLLPLIVDLTNPSPSIGWENKERTSFLSRCDFDLTMCLAFIHHLAIANNLPLGYIADVFAKTSKYLIIEFVPKQDSNTRRLLASRVDIFPDYTIEGFEKEFSRYFKIIKKTKISGSHRIMYLMKKGK